MKITDKIKQSDKALFSLEILPPLKGENIDHINANIARLLDYKPSFIDVTYHQQEVEYRNLPNGGLEKKVVRKRPGTVGISAAIQFKTGVDTVPHLICGGFSKENTENALIDLHFLGIDNILVVRGDPSVSQRFFQPAPDGHAHAIGLVKQVHKMNQGIYLNEDLEGSHPTNFCIGVAGYPEKHSEAANSQFDLNNLKEKVDAGADYIITQMFYDNKKYFDFVKACREIGINVPIIPGLKPIATKRQLTTLPSTFNIDLPDELVSKVQKCKSNIEVRQLGVEWAIAQSKELIAGGAPVIHFYAMGNSDNIEKIAKAVF